MLVDLPEMTMADFQKDNINEKQYDKQTYYSAQGTPQ